MIKRFYILAAAMLLATELHAQVSATIATPTDGEVTVDSLEVKPGLATFKKRFTQVVELSDVDFADGDVAHTDSLKMSQEQLSLGKITINEDESAQRAIESYSAQPQANIVNGYRVGVYFDNSVNARSGAMDVMKRCEMLLHDLPATMSYDNPYFKVSVGYCISEEEAVIMLNRVQKHFRKAYLMREQITIDNIIAARTLETTPIEEEEPAR